MKKIQSGQRFKTMSLKYLNFSMVFFCSHGNLLLEKENVLGIMRRKHLESWPGHFQVYALTKQQSL